MALRVAALLLMAGAHATQNATDTDTATTVTGTATTVTGTSTKSVTETNTGTSVTSTTQTATTTTATTTSPHTTTVTTATTDTSTTQTPATPCERAFRNMEAQVFEMGGACVPIDGRCPAECHQILAHVHAVCAGEYLEVLNANYSAGTISLIVSFYIHIQSNEEYYNVRRLSDLLTSDGRPVSGLRRRLVGYYEANYYQEFETTCTDGPLLAVFENPNYEPTCTDGLELYAFLGASLCGAPGDQCSRLCSLLVDNIFYRCHAQDTFQGILGSLLPDELTAEVLVTLAPIDFSENCSYLLENRSLAPNATILALSQTTTPEPSTESTTAEVETTSLGREMGRTTDEPQQGTPKDADSTSSTPEAEAPEASGAARSLATTALAAALLAALGGM